MALSTVVAKGITSRGFLRIAFRILFISFGEVVDCDCGFVCVVRVALNLKL